MTAKRDSQEHCFSSPGFIVGVGRSGTTLLASILNRHSKVCVTPETHFFRLVYDYPGGVKNFEKNWPDSLREIVCKMHPTRGWQPDADGIISNFDSFPGLDVLFKYIGEEIAQKSGKSLWIEKTPNHINYLEKIRYLFPKAPIIHIVRDGRDVALSLLKVKWASQSYTENLLHWKREILVSKDFFSQDTYSITVRYEDLVQDAESTIKRICIWLGIEFSSDLLVPNGTEDSLIEIGKSHKNNIRAPVNSSRMYRWKQELDVKRKRMASLLLYDELKSFGYEIEHKNLLCNSCIAIRFSARWEKWSSLTDDVFGVLLDLGLIDGIVPFTEFSSILKRISKRDIKYLFVYSLLPRDIWAKTWSYKFTYTSKLFIQLILLYIFNVKVIWLYDGNIDLTVSWPFKRRLEKYISKLSSLIICPLTQGEFLRLKTTLGFSAAKAILLTDNKMVDKIKEHLL